MVYDHPELYAAAYGFRDIAGECDFALQQARLSLGRDADSAAELAAGPALHGRELLRRGLRVAAVEHNPAAVEWLRQVEPRIEVVTADLRCFRLAQPVDLMLCPLSGLAYLLDDASWQSALAAVAAGLRPGGVLVAELAPADADRVAVDTWQVDLPDGRLEVVAGPSRRVGSDGFEWELTLRAHQPAGVRELVTTERQRALSAAAAERLVRRHGGFGLVRCHAGYDARLRYRGGPSLVLVARRATQ